IMIDHIVQWITLLVKPVLPYYVLVLIIIGAIHPFINQRWNESKTSMIFSFFKVIGIFIAFMVVFNVRPAFVLKDNIGPFLYEKLAIPLSVLIPIGALFLLFLVGFCFLEFICLIFSLILLLIVMINSI